MLCSVLQCVAVRRSYHCNAPQHTATHCNTLQYTATHCNTTTYYNALQHTNMGTRMWEIAFCCIWVLHSEMHYGDTKQFRVVCCSMLQSVAVCCSLLYSVAVCCKTHRMLVLPGPFYLTYLKCVVCCSVLQCVAVCCRVLQCVAVCCSVLPCVAVCCSVL